MLHLIVKDASKYLNNPRVKVIECALNKRALVSALETVPVLDGIPYAALVNLKTGKIVIMDTDTARRPSHAEYLDSLVESGFPEYLYTIPGMLYHITYKDN